MSVKVARLTLIGTFLDRYFETIARKIGGQIGPSTRVLMFVSHVFGETSESLGQLACAEMDVCASDAAFMSLGMIAAMPIPEEFNI
ncbi:hypothetical protein [Mesorhizobium hawassense]|uniref:hypothetical protein n=1 Tax=Mesorhizobium hawassense TaxID=1209954 RepID=UPI00142DF199|nr:hypothetical protein [Mesorhizobium hawassense]